MKSARGSLTPTLLTKWRTAFDTFNVAILFLLELFEWFLDEFSAVHTLAENDLLFYNWENYLFNYNSNYLSNNI